MNDESSGPRRRQASAETLAGRQAAALVRDLNQQLGLWQASSVKLQTIAARLSATGKTDPALAEEMRTLFSTVSAESTRFEGMLPEHPETVVKHGRINDTRRSFEMVTSRLRAGLKLLGAETEQE